MLNSPRNSTVERNLRFMALWVSKDLAWDESKLPRGAVKRAVEAYVRTPMARFRCRDRGGIRLSLAFDALVHLISTSDDLHANTIISHSGGYGRNNPWSLAGQPRKCS
jgi:hypothetical protein